MESHYSFKSGAGTPLVFQHGLAANSEQIVNLLGGLHDIELYGIDCAGHGHSLLGNFDPSFKNYSEVLVKQMDHWKLDQVVLGGLSMGSGIALNICLNYPDRVKGLILHRPAWLDYEDPQNLMILKEAVPFIRKENGKERFRDFDSFQYISKTLPTAAKSVMGIFEDTQQNELNKVISCMVGDKPFDDIEMLASIKKPCLIIANDNDPLHPYWMAEKINEKISNSMLQKVTSRYIDNDLHQKEVRQLISEFINKLDR